MSALRRLTVGAVVLGAFAAACQLIAGIDDHDFRLRDAGPLDAGPPIILGPSCAESLPPPPPPPGSYASDHDIQLVLAFETITLPSSDHPVGFDLDGVCTCDSTDKSSHAGRPSCTPPANATVPGGCDFEAGVDNALARVVTEVKGLAAATGVADPIATVGKDLRCGEQTIILVIGEYNGEANDDHVTVAAVTSQGIVDLGVSGRPDVDASECGDTGETKPESGLPIPARRDGLDRWTIPEQQWRFGYEDALDGGSPPDPFGGYVSNYELVVNAT